MDSANYTENKLRFVLHDGGLVSKMDGNSDIGYLTKKDIEKMLVKIANESGYIENFPVEFIIYVRKI